MSTIGINVIETDGTAAPAIAGAPTSVAAIVLRSARGPTQQAVRVSNFRQFVARFGGHDARFTGAYAVEGFFANGGREANVVRVAGSGGAAAKVTLVDRAGKPSLTVAAGYRGTEEAGTWGNALFVDVRDNPEFSTPLAATVAGAQPARLQGEAWAGPTVDLGPTGTPPVARRLQLKVDGDKTFDVVLDASAVPVPKQTTPSDVAAAINAVAGASVVATPSANGILIVSRLKDAASSVEAAAGVDDATRTLLGLAKTSKATGVAAAGPIASTIEVQSFAGLAAGDWVRLDDGITSDWFAVTQLEQTDDGAGQPQFVVHVKAPAGAQAHEYRIDDQSTLSTTEFDLVVASQTPGDPAPAVVETWEKLSMNRASARYAPTIVDDVFAGSGHVVVTDPAPASSDGSDAPALARGVRLGLPTAQTAALTRVAGADGADPTTGDYRDALPSYDTLAVQLLAVVEEMPAAMLRAVTRAALDYCAGKGDCMYVGHTPSGRDGPGAKAFGQDFRAAKVYGALYWPWITITDPAGAGPTPTRVVPPSGHVMGVYARIEQARGVWKAPAGDEAVVRGALAVEQDVTDEDHSDLVKNGSINGIRSIRGTGIVVDASRTLSTDTRWLYVNVRLLFNFVKASLRDGLRWVKQEPNRDALWNMVKFNTVSPFLLRLYQQGAFGTGTPDQVFTVICGAENNPPEEVTLGNLRVEVYFYPSRPAETILIVIGQQPSGASAGER